MIQQEVYDEAKTYANGSINSSAYCIAFQAYTTCYIGWDTGALCLGPGTVRLILGYRLLLKKHFGNDRADTARTS
jgi:hypothetical protein